MIDDDPQSNPAHDLMKVGSMGTLGEERKDFFRMVLKSTITQKTVLFVSIIFDETGLEYDQPFAPKCLILLLHVEQKAKQHHMRFEKDILWYVSRLIDTDIVYISNIFYDFCLTIVSLLICYLLIFFY